MLEQPDFMRRQIAFAAHLRDPAGAPPPDDVEDRRMAIYRDLVFRNVSSLLAGSFPVLRRILPDAHWRALIRDFFVRHRAKSPVFHQLPEEFLDFLQQLRAHDPRDPPFLLELAHYEWVELALQISDQVPDLDRIDPQGDLVLGYPRVSPLAWNLTYRFPVHRIAPDYQPQTPPPDPTHLVVYRSAEGEIGFLEINAVTQRLLVLLQEEPSPSGGEALERVAAELRHPEPDRVIGFGAQLLADLRAKGVLIGTDRVRHSIGPD